MKKIVIVGGGGHAKVVIDILKKNGYSNGELAVLDDNLQIGSTVLGCKVLGSVSELYQYKEYKCVIAIGNNSVRKKIAKTYDVNYITCIHPSAVIGESVEIGDGSVIMANAVVNSGTKVGQHCIINTGATVDHDCKLEDYVHCSPGAHLGGSVIVGESSWVGLGSSICNNIHIKEESIVGAGTVVIRDVPSKVTVVGNPAKVIKHHRIV